MLAAPLRTPFRRACPPGGYPYMPHVSHGLPADLSPGGGGLMPHNNVNNMEVSGAAYARPASMVSTVPYNSKSFIFNTTHSTYNNVFCIWRVEKGASRRQSLCGVVPYHIYIYNKDLYTQLLILDNDLNNHLIIVLALLLSPSFQLDPLLGPFSLSVWLLSVSCAN